jgi:hypothetical protein
MEFSSFNAVDSQNAVFFPLQLRTMARNVFLGLLPVTLLPFGLVQVSSRCCTAAGITFVLCKIRLFPRNCLLSPFLSFCHFVADILNRECLTGEPVLMWLEDWRDPHGKPETIKVFSEFVHDQFIFASGKLQHFCLVIARPISILICFLIYYR